MAGTDPTPFSGPRGIAGLYGTIQRLASRGYTLTETLNRLQEIYAEYGGRWSAQSAAAAERLYTQFADQQYKTLDTSRYTRPIALTSRHISYASLTRTQEQFFSNPIYNVRYHLVGAQQGAPVDLWKTATYEGQGALPENINDLIDNLFSTANTDYEDLLYGADYNVTEVQITAV